MTKRKTKTKKYLRGTRNRYLGGTKKLPEWKLERTLETHSEVNTVCFSPDEKTLASGSKDNKVRLWNVETGVNTKTLVGHSDSVNSVCFSPDGKTLASGSDDKTVRLWNVETGENTKTLTGKWYYVNSVCFSPDGKTLAFGTKSHTVCLWDGENTKILEGHRDYVNSVSFSPDGKTLASGSGDNTVRLWDVKTGEIIKTLQGHNWRVKSVSFLPDGNTLVSGGNDIRLWDVSFLLDEKTLLSESTNIRLWDEKKDKVFKHRLNDSMSLSPDGKKLLYGIFSSDIVDTNWYMLELEKGDVISGETRGYYIGPVCFNTDGKKFAVTMNKGIQIWKHDIKAMIRNRLIETKGWDQTFIQELDPNLMDSAELKELDEYHPDNFLDKIMPKLSEATRTKFNLRLRTPKQTPSTKKKKGNVKPLIESDCKKLDAMYRKYENDLDKLTIVRKKVNKLIKDIKNDKKFNIRRKVTSKNSMPPQKKTRKATLPHASI
jgi:WD40 repeat protein